MKPNPEYLRTADKDFCINTIKEAKQRGDTEMELAYTQRLMYLQLKEQYDD